MNESEASRLRAVGLEDDREALLGAVDDFRRSGLHEIAVGLESALVEHDGANSESRRLLATRREETERLQAAEQRARQHKGFVD